MSLAVALELAAKGFHVFPLVADTKLPAIDDFPNCASRDPELIRAWWTDGLMGWEQPYNVGISTSRFGDNQALVVIDVDNKGKKRGSEDLFALELEGFSLPETYTQVTPTLGEHIVLHTPQALKQGVKVFDSTGLDVRSRGGYIVAAGSSIDGKTYTANDLPVAEAPAWLVERLGKAKPKKESKVQRLEQVDQDYAKKRAIHYLENEAPLSIKGDGGDQTAYCVAARVKDFGVSLDETVELMLDHWNDRCPPGWSPERLREKVEHAFRYGKDAPGMDAPETIFEPIDDETAPDDFFDLPKPKAQHPFDILNESYAFVLAGGGHHILWETKDPDGRYKLEHLAEASFHKKHASWYMQAGNKSERATKLWMESPRRRSYDGMCFRPQLTAPDGYFNLWRGFAVPHPTTPLDQYSAEARDSLRMYLEHIEENVCRGDKALSRWLLGWMAHLIQRPWEKPHTAIVLKGEKGVGKNRFLEPLGHLLGSHFLLTAKRRYLVGNFNGHLQNLLLFALDEAFWSGDKQAEGTLKDLITGSHHVIEHKGKEPYTVENCVRVVIMGNDEWVVPATADERRYAVFDVGNRRQQDGEFFGKMVEGFKAGGYELLLKFLLDFDLSGIDVNRAPVTEGLLEQKVRSLEAVHQWWLACLDEGTVVGGEFSGAWPEAVDKERLRSAFRRYARERNIHSRVPDDRGFGRLLKRCAPNLDGSHKRRERGELINVYKMPELEESRRAWEKFIGHECNWGDP